MTLDTFKKFVTAAEKSVYYNGPGTNYKSWKAGNPELAKQWEAYRTKLLNGETATPPDMGTNQYGLELVLGAQLYVEQLGGPTPVPPDPPVQPPAQGKVKYNLDYSTGNFNQWNEGGSHLQVVSGGKAVVDKTAPLRGGVYSAKFTTPKYDGSNRSRCQIYLNEHPNYACEGIEEWYGSSFQITPGSLLESGGWNNFLSWHQGNTKNTLPAPAHFTANSSDGKTGQLRFDAWGGTYNNSTGANQYRKSFTNLWPLVFGEWLDIVFHVLWSPDPSKGFVEAWVNAKKVIPKTFCAQIYKESDGSSDGNYLKQGYDGGGANGPTTLVHACTKIAEDYLGAISGFPASTWPSTPPA